jgi:uncharacterized protein (TIGR02246 family)
MNPTLTRMAGLAPLLFLAIACAGPSGASLEQDRLAIAAVRAEHLEAVNTTNVELLIRGMAPAVVYLAPGLGPIEGIDALREFVTPIYEEVRPQIAMTPRDVQVVGDVAYEWGLIEGSIILPDGTAEPVNLKYVFVYRRQPDASWVIVYDVYNDNPM